MKFVGLNLAKTLAGWAISIPVLALTWHMGYLWQSIVLMASCTGLYTFIDYLLVYLKR